MRAKAGLGLPMLRERGMDFVTARIFRLAPVEKTFQPASTFPMPPGPDPNPQPPGPDPDQKPAMPRPRRPPPRRPPPRQRTHRRGSVPRARGGVFVIFALLRMVDGFFYIALPAALSIPILIASTLWTTALLVALWRRQYWARIILVALCGIAAAGAAIMAPNSLQDTPLLTAYVIGALVTGGCAAYLIRSRDMHRLTSRERE